MPLALIGLVPNLIIVTVFVVVLGALSGIAYATGYTIVGLEVDDDTRGRVFAFFQSTIQVILLTVIAVVLFLSAAFTKLIAGVTGSGDVKFAHVVYASVGQRTWSSSGRRSRGRARHGPTGRWTTARGYPVPRSDLLAAIRGGPFAPLPEVAHVNGSARAPVGPGAADRL